MHSYLLFSCAAARNDELRHSHLGPGRPAGARQTVPASSTAKTGCVEVDDPAAYLHKAEQLGSQPIVVLTTLEQFDLTFAFSEDPEDLGLGVMRHANTEFEYIVRFLPSLYYAENRALEDVPMPW